MHEATKKIKNKNLIHKSQTNVQKNSEGDPGRLPNDIFFII